jgi:hypothetical protein
MALKDGRYPARQFVGGRIYKKHAFIWDSRKIQLRGGITPLFLDTHGFLYNF